MTSDLALLAERRAGLAALLGLLLLEEPGPAVAELVRDVPGLAALGTGAPDVAVEYERVLLRGVPLYESGFRSDDGQHGGPLAAAVVERYERAGFTEHRERPWRVAGPDHLGLELRCYAQLCQQEALAWRSDTADAAMRAVETERAFLADHVSAWAPVGLRAVSRLAASGPYHGLAGAVDDFLREEHDRLRPAPDLGVPFAVPALPEHLGPARLARLLLSPATCGAWLGADDIETAALALGVPWRPSDTRAALRHVVEAAVDEGELGLVVAMLVPAIRRERDAHLERAAIDPGNAAHAQAWARRAGVMLERLEQVSAQGGLGGGDAPASESLLVSGTDPAALADALDRVVDELRRAGLSVERRAQPG